MSKYEEVKIIDFNDIEDCDEAVRSFLKTRKESHGLMILDTAEWFRWKFYESPYGECMMPCVYDSKANKVVGGNFYSHLRFIYNEKTYKVASPYEAYVHPNYQGRGIFKELIITAEKKLVNQDIDLLVAFPNKNSLKGFLRNGWFRVNNPVSYLLKTAIKFNVIFNLLDIKKVFISDPPKGKNNFNFYDLLSKIEKDKMCGLWTKDYLEWRFNRYPTAKYAYFNLDENCILVRVGKRGKLKECQILFFNIVTGGKKTLDNLLKLIRQNETPDLIGVPISKNYPFYKHLRNKMFIPLKSQTNFVYKPINEGLTNGNIEFILDGLNFHMY